MLCACSRDRADEQRLDSETRIVHLLLRKARVDHVHDAVDCERGLSYVGCNDDFTTWFSLVVGARRWVEDFILLGWRQSAIQGQDFDFAMVISKFLTLVPNVLACLLNFFLARQEDQNVTSWFLDVNLHYSLDRRLVVVFLRRLRIEDFNRVHAAWDIDERRSREVLLEALSVKGCTHHNYLELWALWQDFFEKPKENVSRQSALVSLIKNDDAVLRQHWVQHRLTQQHAICQILEPGLFGRLIFKPNRVTNESTKLDVHLLRDTLGDAHGSDSSRLRTGNILRPCEAGIQEELRHLRRLARTSLSLQDHDLVLGHEPQDFFLGSPRRQLFTLLQDFVKAFGIRQSCPLVNLRNWLVLRRITLVPYFIRVMFELLSNLVDGCITDSLVVDVVVVLR